MTTTSWLKTPSHLSWLDEHGHSLLEFARDSRHRSFGFAWLDDAGRPELDRPVETWITARMVHVFALGHLRGLPGCAPLVDHGIRALDNQLRDREHGGWYASVRPDGSVDGADKGAYHHAFVVLAASSAVVAERPGAQHLLADALDIVERHFWDDEAGRSVDSFNQDWSVPEPYRGANSSMHLVEAFLAAADVTGDPRWQDRARRICEHLIHEVAAAHDWRLPEHFNADWQPLLDYNSDIPADPFRPYGSTVGHWLEWARLLLHVEASLAAPPGWLVDDARSLFAAGVQRGWHVDSEPGFVYTLDWDDSPVVRTRMHWVLAEAISAAATLFIRTGDKSYERWYRTWWDYAADSFLDRQSGSWHHELDPHNVPSATVWQGKPDAYHAYQATLIPQLPLAPVAAVSLRRQGSVGPLPARRATFSPS